MLVGIRIPPPLFPAGRIKASAVGGRGDNVVGSGEIRLYALRSRILIIADSASPPSRVVRICPEGSVSLSVGGSPSLVALLVSCQRFHEQGSQ